MFVGGRWPLAATAVSQPKNQPRPAIIPPLTNALKMQRQIKSPSLFSRRHGRQVSTKQKRVAVSRLLFIFGINGRHFVASFLSRVVEA